MKEVLSPYVKSYYRHISTPFMSYSVSDYLRTEVPRQLRDTLVEKTKSEGGFFVPQMATGGVVKDETLAVVGEGTKPEAVIPLPYGERTLDVLFDELRALKAENRAILEENRILRMELKKALFEVAKYTKKTAETVDKWDNVGMPATEGATA